jgi:hypothetical protein
VVVVVVVGEVWFVLLSFARARPAVRSHRERERVPRVKRRQLLGIDGPARAGRRSARRAERRREERGCRERWGSGVFVPSRSGGRAQENQKMFGGGGGGCAWLPCGSTKEWRVDAELMPAPLDVGAGERRAVGAAKTAFCSPSRSRLTDTQTHPTASTHSSTSTARTRPSLPEPPSRPPSIAKSVPNRAPPPPSPSSLRLSRAQPRGSRATRARAVDRERGCRECDHRALAPPASRRCAQSRAETRRRARTAAADPAAGTQPKKPNQSKDEARRQHAALPLARRVPRPHRRRDGPEEP